MEESLQAQISELKATQIANHRQNRSDIHALRDGQQTILEVMRVGLDKIADRIGERCISIEKDVIDLRLKWAKATGYAVGVSALGAVVFEGVKILLEHTVTK